MLASLTLLTPLGALVIVAVVLPLAAIAEVARRLRATRAALGLRAPRRGGDLAALAALVGTFVLLALAATQPALSHDTVARVRKDAQALFVLDTSRSMAAAASRNGPTRLARAKAAATTLRASIPDVEAGVATLTDRVLPNLLPVADRPSFDATVRRSVGIEEPPPRSTTLRATNFVCARRDPVERLLRQLGEEARRSSCSPTARATPSIRARSAARSRAPESSSFTSGTPASRSSGGRAGRKPVIALTQMRQLRSTRSRRRPEAIAPSERTSSVRPRRA